MARLRGSLSPSADLADRVTKWVANGGDIKELAKHSGYVTVARLNQALKGKSMNMDREWEIRKVVQWGYEPGQRVSDRLK